MNSVDRLNYDRKKINQEYITNHYDDIVYNQHLYAAEKDMTKNLRIINNFIKTGILKNYVKKNDTVLDLGCGKGGDLKKYKSLKIKKYVGVDVSEKSIKEAINRARNLKILPFTQFCIKDAYNDVMFGAKGVSPKLQKFDVITSQFSFHYAFFDDKSLETSVSNINENLKPGGFFIITVPKKNIIINRILKQKAYNSLYSIKDVRPQSNNPESWKSYNFSLIGSVVDCLEYFVNFLQLKKMLEAEKIYLVERTPFVSLLNQYTTKYPDLFTQMKIQKPNSEETDVIGLYEVIVFQKNIKYS
jgi:mRNA (guanine-N7-)-methyltransferase